jgi:regulatory protein
MLIRSGRGVGAKVLLDLRRRGIEESTAQAALAQAGEEFEPLDLLQEQLERRFPGFDYRRADDRLKRRVVSYFQRRGYRLEQIFSLLHDDGDSP